MAIVRKTNSTNLIYEDNNVAVFRMNSNRGGFCDPQDFSIDSDDFLGDSLLGSWSGAKGSNVNGVAPTVALSGALQAKGHMLMTSGNTTVVAESITSLTKGLNYRPSYGNIYMKTAIVLSANTLLNLNVGFSEKLATTTLEEPFSIAGTTITSNAVDAACFVFDTAQTNVFWHLQGVRNNVDTPIRNIGILPAANTTIILEIEIDVSGNATFSINNNVVGIVANAVSPNALLTPVIMLMSRSAASRTLWADYMLITQRRSLLIS